MGRHERKLAKIKAKEELKQIKAKKKTQKAEKQKKQLEDWNNASRGVKITALVITALIGLVIIGLVASSAKNSVKTDSTQSEAAKDTSYQAEVLGYNVVDPATLRVSVKVKNTGQSKGKPDCTINATNSTGVYKGFDVFGMDRAIEPGQEDYFNGQLTITKEGSVFVDKVTVSCS